MKASFYVSQLIAKSGKPRTIVEEHALPSTKIMISDLINYKAVKDLSIIPLCKDTVTRRINDLSGNNKE